jgi:conjugal transfer pilus assembly protein TraK
MMPITRLALLVAVLAASAAQADPAFEVPVVPCSLLDGHCGAAASRSVLNGAWAQPSQGGLIRTLMGGPGRVGERNAAGVTPVALELGARHVTVSPGTTVLIEIAIGHLNRIVTPFASPVVHTVSPASTQVDGSIVYLATDTGEPLALYVSDAPGSATALSLTLAPRYVPPREIRLTVPGYNRRNPMASPPAEVTTGSSTMLANAAMPEIRGGAHPYVAGIVELLRAVAQGRVPPGYGVKKGAGTAKVRCAEGLKLRKTQLTEDPASSVVTAAVRNASQGTLTIDQYACDIDNRIIAALAAWPRKVLAPGEETEIFLVLGEGDRLREPAGRPR